MDSDQAGKDSKENTYVEKFVGSKRKFECLKCGRMVNSKHSILKHLYTQHGLSPLKPVRMLYKHRDKPVPRSTMYRWKATTCKQNLTCSESKENDNSSSAIESSLAIGNDVNTGDPVDLESPPTITNTDAENLQDHSPSDSYEDSSSINFDSSEISSEDETSVDNLCVKSKITENNAMKLLSCFKKHKVTANGCKDILKTLRDILPELKSNPILNYGHLLSHVPPSAYKEIGYCCKCESKLDDGSIVQCENDECSGITKSFMIANVQELLKSLLQAPGILDDITRNQEVDSDYVTDIYSGELYKRSKQDASPSTLYLTCVLNTDGVNLYSSSKVELWPVFLAINELSPSLRFSRENILLAGLWQGKGKPPFKLLLEHASKEINTLTESGLKIEVDGETKTVHLRVLCVTLDLPAKAGVMNMTLFNGQCACITCEEPGIVVTQGRGHSRSYPYRSLDECFPNRFHETVLQNMATATEKDRQKGFKGLSGLTFLQDFDLVDGVVPDYMHCVLLGIVKKLLSKWFSPTESGNPYFVGKNLKQISERFLKIRPPYFIERLPRDLEKHYSHFKATELQNFLLYYSIPCLHNILPDKFLQHFALLSEAIYILLGDHISTTGIQRSEYLLQKFYSKFALLYGDGSCGLNVHNACAHMTDYVKKLGPIWCWSCFAFEDANSVLLQSVHGTGDVVKQALRNQDISVYIRSLNNVKPDTSAKLKVTHRASNCTVIGLLKPLNHQIPLHIIQTLQVESNRNLKKAERVLVNGVKFYSAGYSRMRRRHCHAVIYSDDQFGLIQYFLLEPQTNLVYAVIKEIEINNNSWICSYEAAKQFRPVEVINTLKAILAHTLHSTLVFIDLEHSSKAFIIQTPNRLGHAVLK